MIADLHDPWLGGVIARSNLADHKARPANLAEQLTEAARPMASFTDAILEISRVGRHKLPDGAQLGTIDVLLVVFPFELVLVVQKGMLKKRLETERAEYMHVKAAVEDTRTLGDGRTGEFAIQFLGAGSVPLFRLAWQWWRSGFGANPNEQLAAATERDRILTAIQSAMRRDFSAYER
ncbi:MAG: hypothetical protein ACLGI2_09430 [Acidimicrobiia bacterium]